MPIEIERKFLVTGDDWKSYEPTLYVQGYLNRDQKRTIRVRIGGDSAFLTIKGPTVGATRHEFEYPIPVEHAQAILELCEQPLIEKYRRNVPHAGFTWEVDQFLGVNEGLVIAEVELESVDQPFERPEWVGQEVTEDPRYYNSNLSLAPFQTWEHG